MQKFVFVILHYNAIEVTIECIESIFKNARDEFYQIIIVDNHSPNGTGPLLKEMYEEHPKIEVLLLQDNLGFAKGNNVGYQYAKEVLGADFIIMPHNDVIFMEDQIIPNIIKIFETTGFGILGPKILSQRTQNPHKPHLVSRREVKRILHFYKRERIKNFVMTALPMTGLYNLLRSKKRSFKAKRSKPDVEHFEQMTDVTLHAACIVFSPLFINKFDYAFYPEPFMFFDEDLLHYMCAKEKLKVLFDPSILVLHKESQATESITKTPLIKSKFINKHIINSVKVLYRLMKEDHYYSINDFK